MNMLTLKEVFKKIGYTVKDNLYWSKDTSPYNRLRARDSNIYVRVVSGVKKGTVGRLYDFDGQDFIESGVKKDRWGDKRPFYKGLIDTVKTVEYMIRESHWVANDSLRKARLQDVEFFHSDEPVELKWVNSSKKAKARHYWRHYNWIGDELLPGQLIEFHEDVFWGKYGKRFVGKVKKVNRVNLEVEAYGKVVKIGSANVDIIDEDRYNMIAEAQFAAVLSDERFRDMSRIDKVKI